MWSTIHFCPFKNSQSRHTNTYIDIDIDEGFDSFLNQFCLKLHSILNLHDECVVKRMIMIKHFGSFTRNTVLCLFLFCFLLLVCMLFLFIRIKWLKSSTKSWNTVCVLSVLCDSTENEISQNFQIRPWCIHLMSYFISMNSCCIYRYDKVIFYVSILINYHYAKLYQAAGLLWWIRWYKGGFLNIQINK